MRVGFKVKSPSNIALIKYWGQQDPKTVLPANKSLSFNLSEFYTVTEFQYGDFEEDSYEFEGEQHAEALEHISRVREFMMKRGVFLPHVKVFSENNFPSSCGLASSASAYSALTFGLFALSARFGGAFDRSDLIEMTRLSGSASAVRSLGDGFVGYDPVSPGELIEFDEDFDLVDVVCIVDDNPKVKSSADGHGIALSSPFYKERVEGASARFDALVDCLKSNNFDSVFGLIDDESCSFLLNHFTSNPRVNYLKDKCLELIYLVKASSLPASFTFDAGNVVHIITRSEFAEQVAEIVSVVCDNVTMNYPSKGVELL